MALRFLTAGESHGPALSTIIEGIPAGFQISKKAIDIELKRRQSGYGRGGRMKIESDQVQILSGVRFGRSIGSPVALLIQNNDWHNWQIPMSVMEIEETDENIAIIKEKEITKVRPGHADFSGAIKYRHKDVRNILERSSARETTTRVAVGSVAKQILDSFGIFGFSHITQIGEVKANVNRDCIDIDNIERSELRCADNEATEAMKKLIDSVQKRGDTLGGSFEVIYKNLPIGLGSHVHWDRKLDGLLAQAIMSIPAVKSVEIGLGHKVAEIEGSKTHDEVFFEDGKYSRKTNNAGGIEGGMTNGEDIVIKVAMKAIPTMKTPLNSVSLDTHESYLAHFERSDTCAVPACAVVAESMAAIVLVNSFMDKFGSDSFSQIKDNYENYLEYVKTR